MKEIAKFIQNKVSMFFVWLDNNKDRIVSISSILSSLGVIVTMYVAVDALVISPNKPALDILSTPVNEHYERIVIYNGGKGACVELKVTLSDEDHIGTIAQIINYEESWNTGKHSKGSTIVTKARYFDYFNKSSICREGVCTVDAGYLGVGKVFPIQISKANNPVKVQASCIGALEEQMIY